MNPKENPEMIRIMVVDDHQLLIDGIKSALADSGRIRVVAEAHNGKAALELLEKVQVDVVLMDINMPVMDGLECTQIITKTFPEIRVIAISQYPEKRFIKNMLKNGASGYLLKDTGKEELGNAILKVSEGGTYLNERLSQTINFQAAKPDYNLLFPELTPRQKEILKLIIEEYSSQEIGDKLNLSFHTVETHRANLMLKAGARNTAGLVRWAFENDIL